MADFLDFLGTSEPKVVNHYGHLAPDYQAAAAMAIGRRSRGMAVLEVEAIKHHSRAGTRD